MKDQAKRIARFFDEYARRTNAAIAPKPKIDTEGVTKSFADFFVGSSPTGVQGGKNGVRFRLMIPRGFAFYRKIGTTAMNVSSLRVTRLDEMHYMAKVNWDSLYVTKRGARKRIRFTNIYFLQIWKGRPRIFAYITGDEAKVLKENGLT